MFGDGFIAQHVAQYCEREAKEKALVAYVTEGLKVLTENTARISEGKALGRSFSELMEPPEEADASEIIERIKNKIGGEN